MLQKARSQGRTFATSQERQRVLILGCAADKVPGRTARTARPRSLPSRGWGKTSIWSGLACSRKRSDFRLSCDPAIVRGGGRIRGGTAVGRGRCEGKLAKPAAEADDLAD